METAKLIMGGKTQPCHTLEISLFAPGLFSFFFSFFFPCLIFFLLLIFIIFVCHCFLSSIVFCFFYTGGERHDRTTGLAGLALVHQASVREAYLLESEFCIGFEITRMGIADF